MNMSVNQVCFGNATVRLREIAARNAKRLAEAGKQTAHAAQDEFQLIGGKSILDDRTRAPHTTVLPGEELGPRRPGGGDD